MRQKNSTFFPAWWCRNPHAQTIIAALFRKTPTLPVDRERWHTPDGDFLDIDRVQGKQPDVPRVVLLHGLEGSSSSNDIRGLMAVAHQLGWESIAMNFRSCSGELNRLRRMYHAGETSDLAWVIKQLLAEDKTRPIVCIGISLGGNVLLKYLGERQDQVPDQLKAAVTISTPYNLNEAIAYIEQGFSMLYIKRFLLSLKRKTRQKLQQYPDLIDRKTLNAIQTLSEFDDRVVAPVNGFPNADTYWRLSSSQPFLPKIQRPTLLINAVDDPFFPPGHLPASGNRRKSIFTGRFSDLWWTWWFY